MDVFQLLPPEMRSKILGHLLSVKDIQRVADASRAMFRQVQVIRMPLYRGLIKAILDKEHYKLALAAALLEQPDLENSQLNAFLELTEHEFPSPSMDDQITERLAEICTDAWEAADPLVRSLDEHLRRSSNRKKPQPGPREPDPFFKKLAVGYLLQDRFRVRSILLKLCGLHSTFTPLFDEGAAWEELRRQNSRNPAGAVFRATMGAQFLRNQIQQPGTALASCNTNRKPVQKSCRAPRQRRPQRAKTSPQNDHERSS